MPPFDLIISLSKISLAIATSFASDFPSALISNTIKSIALPFVCQLSGAALLNLTNR